MLEKVLGVGAVRRWLYLAAKPPHVGVDADGLSCSLHHPSTCGWCLGVQSSWFENALPNLVAKHFLRESLPQWAHRSRLLGWGLEPLDTHHLV
jgi:hypothetical protein